MNRIEKLKQKQSIQVSSAFVVFSERNIRYLSGFSGHAATLLLMENISYLITDYRYLQQAEAETQNIEVICRDRQNQTLGNLIQQLLVQHGVQSLKFEADHITVGGWADLSSEFPEHTLIATQRAVEDLRYYKSTEEINSIRKAAAIADQALKNMLEHVKEGVTEKQLSTDLEYQMSLLGSEELSFPTILLFAERSALPHGVPGDKKLNKGDLILVDFGAVVNGYRSDMTRTFVFGEANAQQKDIYQLVARAQKAAIDALHQGISGKDLNAHSEQLLSESEYGRYQGEGLGHGVGMDLHEFPFINKNCELIIDEGCVITIEPGIYIPGWGGIRIEDDIAMIDGQIEVLTQFPRELMEL